MDRTLFIVFIIIINLSSLAQEDKSVEIYEGRGSFDGSHKILDLSHRNLTSVPAQAIDYEIEVLILDNNNLDKLPNWIGQLKNLKVLSIRNNNLVEINSTLSLCEKLEQIYLNGNKNLTSLPSLRRCKSLLIIDVIDTGIYEVPPWIRTIDNLLYFKYSVKE